VKRRDAWLGLAALVSVGAYLGLSALRGAIGFPLDDAWIHQVYARNLAARGEFAFFAGQPSAGSTSPLWTILLSVGYLLRVDFRAWAYLLGIMLLGASAMIATRLFLIFDPSASRRTGFRFSIFDSRITDHASRIMLCFLLFLLFEWHLAWSAASGMEILLFVFLSLILLERFYARAPAWLLGLLAGLLTLTRPEGAVLAALVGGSLSLRGAILSERSESKDATKQSPPPALGIASQKTLAMTNGDPRLSAFIHVPMTFALGLAVVLTPYLLFNLATSGTIFPNTLYAKSAEYAVLFEQTPLILRWLQLLFVPFVGAQILLLPGVLYVVVTLARQRQWLALIPFAWVLLLPALYALRLPVAYQHGRYEMPVIPFIVLYGIWGTGALLARVQNWVVRTTWALSTATALIVFWILGAIQYATDVAIIDCEMAQTARWVAAHAPADAVIAAHDIGALGYYYDRPFIDLAGLATPEVIPFIRDEGRLREYLVSRQATFVIVFPGWYPAFDADPSFAPIYRTNCVVTRETGEKNMVVYRMVQ